MRLLAMFFLAAAALAATMWNASAVELRPETGGTRYEFGWRLAEVSDRAPEKLSKEPSYQGGRPLYFGLILGNGPDLVITAAFDDADRSSRGREVLYIDANNNGDQTDDPIIRPKITQDGFATIYAIEPFDVLVKYMGGARRRLNVKMEAYANHHRKKHTWWSIGYQVNQHLTGRLDMGGGQRMLLSIYDATHEQTASNGCFDDYCVDRIRLDLNGDGKLCGDTEDFPLSRIIAVKGHLWELHVDSAGRNVSVKRSSRPTGTVAFKSRLGKQATISGGRMEVSSPALGYAFVHSVTGGKELVLPEGRYQVTRASVRAADADGTMWESVFSMPQPFMVRRRRGASVALGTFGPPIKVEPRIRGRLMPGRNVCIWPYISGVGGEQYQDISPAMKRMIPTLDIVDPNGITVLSAKMEYG